MTKETKEVQIYDTNNAVEIKKAAWNSLSKESQKSYQIDYRLFFEFVNKDLREVVPSDILAYVNHLKENGYKNSSINRKIASLSKMFRVARMAGDIQSNPVEVLKEFKNIVMKTSKEVHISLSLADIRRAIKPRKKDTIKDQRITMIIRTLTTTGLRISELTGIKNKDFSDHNKSNKKIRIVGKGDKERFIFMGNGFLREIRKIYPIGEGVEYLFHTSKGTRYSRNHLYYKIRDFFEIRIKKKVHPHMLRHFFATHKINTEKRDIKAVSLFLGHSSVKTTLDAYVDTSLSAEDAKIKI